MADWPSTLSILLDNYSEEAPDRVIRSQMDVGPAKIRRRSSAAVRNISLNLFLNDAQVETFDDFFDANDALVFNFTNPRTAVVENARFTSKPSYTRKETMWAVSVQLELLP